MNSSIETPIIGIIGNRGKYGVWLTKHFESLGFQVIGSDLTTELKNKDVVEQAHIIIFSLPISETVKIISELTEFSREDQLWMDVTSVKAPAVEAMLQSKAEVVGLHPMCAPTVETLKHQNLIVCRARVKNWELWLNAWLKKTHAIVKETTPEEHDKYTAITQALVHALVITFSTTIFKTGSEYTKLLEFASPTFRTFLALSGRVLSQSPEMYAEIQMSNPTVLQVLEVASNSLDYLHKVVVSKHKEEFEKIFTDAKEYMGLEQVEQAQELFKKFL